LPFRSLPASLADHLSRLFWDLRKCAVPVTSITPLRNSSPVGVYADSWQWVASLDPGFLIRALLIWGWAQGCHHQGADPRFPSWHEDDLERKVRIQQ